jgi:ubiquinone/menaquinone biosynthesis C-methylase UbiE
MKFDNKYYDNWHDNKNPRLTNKIKYTTILKIIKKGPILDVGCGNCNFLEICKNKKLNAQGIDFSRKAVELARKKGFKVKIGDSEKIPFKDNSFATITLLDVLEHVYSPRKTLDEIYRVLKINGELVIVIPNTFSIRRLLSGPDKSKEHINKFDYFTIKPFIENCGFKIKSIQGLSRFPLGVFSDALLIKAEVIK